MSTRKAKQAAPVYIRPDGHFNIPRSCHDPHFRYHMPSIVATVESRGNGIKTWLPNIKEISAAVYRPVEYVTRYLSADLGASIVHKPDSNKWVFTGEHQAESVAKALDGFIAGFVLCPTCQDPGTLLLPNEKQELTLDCKACGTVSRVTANPRFASFVLKHPLMKAKSGDYMPPEWMEEKPLTDQDKDFEAEWTVEEKEEDPVDALARFFALSPRPPSSEIKARVEELSNKHGWKRADAIKAVFGALFGNGRFAERFKLDAPVLRLFVTTSKDQARLLMLFEKLCSIDPTALAKTCTVLQQWYEKDVLDEKVIKKWYDAAVEADGTTTSAVRQKATRFIEWLSNAESDDDDA